MRIESAKEAALSMGLNVGEPVESLAVNMTIVADKITDTLSASLRWLNPLPVVNCCI